MSVEIKIWEDSEEIYSAIVNYETEEVQYTALKEILRYLEEFNVMFENISEVESVARDEIWQFILQALSDQKKEIRDWAESSPNEIIDRDIIIKFLDKI